MADLIETYTEAILQLPYTTRKAYASGRAYESDPAAETLLQAFVKLLNAWQPDTCEDEARVNYWKALDPISRRRFEDGIHVVLKTNRRSDKTGLKSIDRRAARRAAEATASRVYMRFVDEATRDPNDLPAAPSVGGWAKRDR
ncbi:hypothetical protein KUV46_15570 [Thalassovita mediterranea]|nr:hypothetical protein KUV46_15570 [Thalassovita mediterranea]